MLVYDDAMGITALKCPRDQPPSKHAFKLDFLLVRADSDQMNFLHSPTSCGHYAAPGVEPGLPADPAELAQSRSWGNGQFTPRSLRNPVVRSEGE